MLCFWRGLCKVYYRRIGGTTKPQLGARSLMFSACPSHPEAQLHHGAPSPLQTPNPPAVELGQTPADCQAVFLGGGGRATSPFSPIPVLAARHLALSGASLLGIALQPGASPSGCLSPAAQ